MQKLVPAWSQSKSQQDDSRKHQFSVLSIWLQIYFFSCFHSVGYDLWQRLTAEPLPVSLLCWKPGWNVAVWNPFWQVWKEKGVFSGIFYHELGCAVAPGFYIFTFLRVITSIGSAGLVASYVLCMEVIGSSYRSFAGMVFHVFFSLGYPLLAVMAYYIRSWRTLFVVTTLSGAVVGLMWRWVW